VPNSLEAIIGKASIDELDTLPLVEIEYNIHKTVNRVVKRAFDVFGSSVLLVLVYPWMALYRLFGGMRKSGRLASSVLLLPQVFLGRLSFVGLPMSEGPELPMDAEESPVNDRVAYLGPKGLTGIVQINMREGLEQEEIEKYKLYYAKNQSLTLDLEIIAKSLTDLAQR
jgi:lipopolysaccharide/colanic/teichoic acid biosynthesis glycosyltransferase